MGGRYSTIFNAIGFYLQGLAAEDLFIQELDDGFLVACVVGGTQRVETFEASGLERLEREVLQHESAERHESLPGPWPRLWAIGHFLDKKPRSGVVVQDFPGGCLLEFTARSNDLDDLSILMRFYEELDDTQIQAIETAAYEADLAAAADHEPEPPKRWNRLFARTG